MPTPTSNKLAKLHKELCRELGIHPARLRFDDDIPVFGRYSINEQAIRINIPLILAHGRSIESTLAHETYHHYQHVRGWLTRNHYRGKLKLFIRYQREYKDWPWEVGARRYAAKQQRLRGWK